MNLGAVERAAAGLDNAQDARTGSAPWAGLPFPAIDLPGVLEIAELSIGLDIVAQTGSACGDRLGQRGLYLRHQPSGPGARDGVGQAQRADAGAKQRLADIDIAQTGDVLLVQQRCLDRRALAGQGGRQAGDRKIVAQRLRAQPRQQTVCVLAVGAHQVDRTEAAGIDETDPPAAIGAGIGLQHHVFMQRTGVVASGWLDQHAPGHAEMDQYAVPARQAHQDVFGAPAKAEHLRAGQARGEAGRKRPPQIGPADLGAYDPSALQLRLQASHHRLDFGQFRNGGVPACAGERYTWRPMSDNPPAGQPVTDFGFQQVPLEAKKPMVRAVFDSVATRYDLMNDLMSLGIHRVWKRVFTTALDPRPGATLLDLAGGTGDISFAWLAAGGGPVLLSDINYSMLSVGRDRALERGFAADVALLVADAERLPLPDRSVDRVSMAFGLRNCTDKNAVLSEARRVLRPGGRFLCLEFSKVRVAALAPVYETWSFKVLPRIGRMVAQDEDSYRYLAESIRMFPDQDTLAEMMRRAGFARVSVQNLSGGIAAIHKGWRL